MVQIEGFKKRNISILRSSERKPLTNNNPAAKTVEQAARLYYAYNVVPFISALVVASGHSKKSLYFMQEENMKNYAQVYVKNSFEAAKLYCKAFGAEITLEMKNEAGTTYEHCELSVNGEGFLALSEAANTCDIELVHKMKWETMTFNVFEMGSEESVCNAFNTLSDGGVIIHPVQEVPWNKCCATVIDKFGVCWWIAI